MPQTKHTFCRICEPYCPLIAELDDAGQVVALIPNARHPSGSIACHKGLTYLDVHNDPDRVNRPQKRLNSRSDQRGEFAEVDWDAAMAEMGATLKRIRDTHGPSAIAVYVGNPWAMSGPPILAATEFQNAIGTHMRFNTNTQDCANRFVCAAEVYGSPSAIMVPDLYETHYLLCLGSNPKVSRWTATSVPNDDLEVVKRIVRRGGRVRFINPRHIESSTPDTGPTLLIRPGTDVYFLAALLHELDIQGGFDQLLLSKYGKHVEELRQFVHNYPAERVAEVTGIAASELRTIAGEIIAAKSAAVYLATGLNQSRQGILCNWLVEMINFASGNLGRPGGMHKPTGLANYFPPSGPKLDVKTSVGVFQLPDPIFFGALPGVLLPQMIENGDIRALVVLGGNPLITVGGEHSMRKAFEKLQIIVSVDIYRNATGEMADYVLPATDWLERMDINIHGSGMQPLPYVQYADAIEPPAFARRNGWWIVARLSQAMGLPSPLDASPQSTDGHELIDGLLAPRGLSIEKLRGMPQQTVTFAQESRDAVFDKCLQHVDKKIDCCPASFAAAGLFARCEDIFRELSQEPADTLKLISLRTRYMQNSWLTNTEKFRRGMQCINPLHMHEMDAVARGLYDGDWIRVFNKNGSIETQLHVNDELRPGVVAMSHGYGNTGTFGLRTASEKPGVNCNVLMPMGTEFEPMSYMSWMSGVPVQVEGSVHAPTV